MLVIIANCCHYSLVYLYINSCLGAVPEQDSLGDYKYGVKDVHRRIAENQRPSDGKGDIPGPRS